jgi:arginine exporter protein ArgO
MPAKSFFEKPITNQTHNETFHTLLLEFIIKNNLSFSLIDQLETKALFVFLNPNIKYISRRILIGDLKAQYQVREEKLY